MPCREVRYLLVRSDQKAQNLGRTKVRILLQGRESAGERRGGDSTVAARLAREMRSRGHEVVIAARPPEAGLRGFDVVHAINLDRSVLSVTETLARSARAAGVRLVLTPLWWPLDRYVASLPRAEALAFRAKGIGALRAVRERRAASVWGVRRRQATVLAGADAVCPSGAAEAFALEDEFGTLPTTVVPFGTDRRPPAGNGDRAGVLCVGRLDPRKNQLGLIEALRGTGIPLRLVGTDAIFPAYAARCRQAAGPGVLFSGYVDDEDLRQAHLRARVHALPSFFELPGLVSLDAAALGAAVVVSRAGTPEDYFGRDAWYCSTDSSSIREAVLAAYEAGPPKRLAERIAEAYPWGGTAERYLGAYEAT